MQPPDESNTNDGVCKPNFVKLIAAQHAGETSAKFEALVSPPVKAPSLLNDLRLRPRLSYSGVPPEDPSNGEDFDQRDSERDADTLDDRDYAPDIEETTDSEVSSLCNGRTLST